MDPHALYHFLFHSLLFIMHKELYYLRQSLCILRGDSALYIQILVCFDHVTKYL